MNTFERRHEQLAPRRIFLRRWLRFILLSLVIIIGSLVLGAAGYAWFAKLSWINGFHAAAMILFSEGPVAVMPTYAAKVWEICYSTYSGVAFFTIIGTLWAPVIHRFYHQFHLSLAGNRSENE